MMIRKKVVLLSFIILLIFAVHGFSQDDVQMYQKLTVMHQTKTAPGPYDWLAVQPEPGQSYADYVKSNPILPNKNTQYIYISLLGSFDDVSKDIVQKAARFIEAYYQLKVIFADPIPLSLIPPEAQRLQPLLKNPQILTTYIIDKLLLPRKPPDAFCYIAFTTSDLWPGAGWNFVFGQASLDDRVGVWSINRNGNPRKSYQDYQLCLRRTISTGVHEIGHMFSLMHCIYYECNMNGSNYRKESDARPLWLCPICLRKLLYVLKGNPLERYKNLATISRDLDLTKEDEFYEKSIAILEGK